MTAPQELMQATTPECRPELGNPGMPHTARCRGASSAYRNRRNRQLLASSSLQESGTSQSTEAGFRLGRSRESTVFPSECDLLVKERGALHPLSESRGLLARADNSIPIIGSTPLGAGPLLVRIPDRSRFQPANVPKFRVYWHHIFCTLELPYCQFTGFCVYNN